MKKTLLAATIAITSAFSVQAELIQHTDQIAEVKFTGSTYELGKHVGNVGHQQIMAGIERFDSMLGVMLEGMDLDNLKETFDKNDVYGQLKIHSPDSAEYIAGLSDALNLEPNYLLALGMSDEAVFESQRSGGLGFLEESEKKAEAPAKCTVMGKTNGKGKAIGLANFDYMGINEEGLMVINHTDLEGNTKLIQTWIGLIPYGGVTAGGHPLLMNTMSDEGTARQHDNGPILAKGLIPSYKMSWDVYNAKTPDQVKDVFDAGAPTTYFSYLILDANGKVSNVENGYKDSTRWGAADSMVHSNHSNFVHHDFIEGDFGGQTLLRKEHGETLLATMDMETEFKDVLPTMQHKPLYKGRGGAVSTVTTTFWKVDGKNVDMSIYTDANHPVVTIKNY
ncbi:hypothetical protein ABT56_12835 [Photobacterium aquae]|uniref:Uncharacterized protein n=1 Tax=Photobacterium aquae TaxID=1195763 RepID=A0A0J1GZN7_9GAMM|nr:hypothetical protein [Photobacterium aquae]KLV05083.1 hypothetical protein ABT56_12835 [Photobacterium aquae]